MVQMPGFYSQIIKCKKKPPTKEVVHKETSI
jgi:hypothetical protein